MQLGSIPYTPRMSLCAASSICDVRTHDKQIVYCSNQSTHADNVFLISVHPYDNAAPPQNPVSNQRCAAQLADAPQAYQRLITLTVDHAA